MISQDNQQYLTVDVFNAKMNAYMATVERKIDTSTIELKNEIRLNATDTTHLQTSVYWGFAIVAIVIALVGLVATLAPTFLSLVKDKKSYTTVEQVQEIVDKAIARAFSSISK